MLISENILIFTGVVVTTAILMNWWTKKRKRSNYRYPPALPSLPLVGSLPFIRNVNDVSVFYEKKSRELGPIFTLRVGRRLVLILNTRDAIEKAAARNSSVFSDRPEVFMEKLTNPELKGLLSMKKATEWKKHQNLTLSILKEFGFGMKSIMEEIIGTEVNALIEYILKKQGKPFDPSEVFFLVTSNVIHNFVFGRRHEYELGISDLSAQLHRFASNIVMAFDIVPIIRFLPSYRQIMREGLDAKKRIFDILEREIARTLQDSARSCFVKSYVERVGPDYDRDQLKFLLRDLGAGGTDTSATDLQWCLIAMANYPDVQRRVHAEIEAVLPGDQLPTLRDQTKLPYVEATILEISRWRTLAPLAMPRMTASDSVVDGFFIPGDTMVFLNLYAAHNDPEVWDEPKVFRPERFLDKENNVIGKDRVIQFSVGRRSCPGEVLARAEIFMIFASLVKRFLILPPEGQSKISEDNKVPVATILAPLPFKIRLIART